MANGQPSFAIFGEVARRLREERLRLGDSQEEFGRKGGASLQTQTRYETNKQVPKLEYLVALGDHGVDWRYILTGRRDDGSIGFTEQVIRDLIGKLDDREREAVMQLLLVLTGSTTDLVATDRARGDVATVHSPPQGYRSQQEE